MKRVMKRVVGIFSISLLMAIGSVISVSFADSADSNPKYAGEDKFREHWLNSAEGRRFEEGMRSMSDGALTEVQSRIWSTPVRRECEEKMHWRRTASALVTTVVGDFPGTTDVILKVGRKVIQEERVPPLWNPVIRWAVDTVQAVKNPQLPDYCKVALIKFDLIRMEFVHRAREKFRDRSATGKDLLAQSREESATGENSRVSPRAESGNRDRVIAEADAGTPGHLETSRQPISSDSFASQAQAN